jgi:cytochrome b pre-mRNA-processing protein 3
MFDLIFNKIEQNMREIGFGDVSINKNMRFLIKVFYNILLSCEKYRNMSTDDKVLFFNKFLLQTKDRATFSKNSNIIKYFNKYDSFCFDLSSDSVLRGDLKFNYK